MFSLRCFLTDTEAVVGPSGHYHLLLVTAAGGQLFAAYPHPLHKGVVHEDVAVVNDELHFAVESLVAGEETLAEGAVSADGACQVDEGAGESERDELRNGQLHTGPEGISEIDHNYVAG
jgi:hypothetical protein